VGERLFQLLQLRRRAMLFYPGEIGHGEYLREQRGNVVQMCQGAFGVETASFRSQMLYQVELRAPVKKSR
jgi:hypothetical protein